MITEIKQDLFTVPEDYALVHCISSDFALGAGIAKEFQKRYATKNELRTRCPGYQWQGGACLGTGTSDTRIVFNLVTKQNYWEKPAYKDLTDSLTELREMCELGSYKKLAMPKIGCGLDGLKWERVKSILEDVFDFSNIEILVCSLE